jgi:hypothetical protein
MAEDALVVDNSVRLALKAVADLPRDTALRVLQLASELLAGQDATAVDPEQFQLVVSEYGDCVIAVVKELLQIEAGDCRCASSVAQAAIAMKLKEYEPPANVKQ